MEEEKVEIKQEKSLDEIEQEIVERKQEIAKRESENKLVTALINNDTAIEMAKKQYEDLRNQKNIADKMSRVVNRKTNADIDTANIKVEEQEKDNKVKKQQIKNELLKLKNDRIYLVKEQKHRLEMQRAKQLREKYEDLLLRTCRKKQKGEDKKWHYVNDENGKPIINVPGKIRFFFIRLFDGIVSGLNQIAEILGAINKSVLKGSLIVLILLLLLVPPFREWLLGLIGINLG